MKKLYTLLSALLILPAVSAATLPAPKLKKPANGSSVSITTPKLIWAGVKGADGYRTEIYQDKKGKKRIGLCKGTETSCKVGDGYLQDGGKYWWKVWPSKKGKMGKPSALWAFSVSGGGEASEDQPSKSAAAAKRGSSSSFPDDDVPGSYVRGKNVETASMKSAPPPAQNDIEEVSAAPAPQTTRIVEAPVQESSDSTVSRAILDANKLTKGSPNTAVVYAIPAIFVVILIIVLA